MDEAEVTNLHWLEYLHFLRQDSTEKQYQAAKPDTAVWNQLSASDPYVAYYLRYPGFRYFPVVGITYAQVLNYCRWRTAKVYENTHSAEYLRKHPKLKDYDYRIEYRLPTVREWELAAGGSSLAEYPYGTVPPAPTSKVYRQQLVRQSAEVIVCLRDNDFQGNEPVLKMPFNVREHFYVGSFRQAFNCTALNKLAKNAGLNGGQLITDYAYSHPPNSRGYYNMIGNVAELTSTPGIAKGGSFWQSINSFTLQTNLPYSQPQMWLGFRCAATVFISPKP